ncbi:hypothetical protein AQUCO_04600012v1 [Aquilegia coerulea]|uniref:Rab-GAP TBC domain-containing protein n=1 Tax=Aquilegia coerulea TaxID=218851 RepID=A0A2G5CL93_AQUCA|nr:hypothetical protein AQUCO_04600012v1 [Aquilegia coerulea]
MKVEGEYNNSNSKRDAYGFVVRPQHLQSYREYAAIYKEEEVERSEKWKDFLKRQAKSTIVHNTVALLEKTVEDYDSCRDCKPESNGSTGKFLKKQESSRETRTHKVQIWTQIRPSLGALDHMMRFRVKKSKHLQKNVEVFGLLNQITVLESSQQKGHSEEDSDEEFYDVERSDRIQEAPLVDRIGTARHADTPDPSSVLKEELEFLVHGGVPMALRGELWQAFVGVKARRVDTYYQKLLASDTEVYFGEDCDNSNYKSTSIVSWTDMGLASEKWKGQIEKDLPRTFPGHPALDEDGRNALRRLLTAYARHNPSVGYCQAMNFFAGLLLLLMSEENAFWSLMGIMDDYFDGYYSEEMIESQVDQFVFEELVRERFPRLVNHLDYLGVQVAWVTGSWFLSVFVNILPWETVLRIWDVLLFEGNRVVLFRTALALIELYGPALITAKDAGDAVTLLQSLAGATFDSSQLVLTACMCYQAINEARLVNLRDKHRPAVIAAIEERSRGLRVWRDSHNLAPNFCSFDHHPGSLMKVSPLEPGSTDFDNIDVDSSSDLQVQVAWLKVELSRLLQEKSSAILRAEELQSALMEMVNQDDRHELNEKVEALELNVSEVLEALARKQDQERAILQVLMRVEKEQKVTEDARRLAEQDATAQKFAADTLQFNDSVLIHQLRTE